MPQESQPPTRRGEGADPYRWLEQDRDETRAWIQTQHAYTAARLAALPGREALRARLRELAGAGTSTTPVVAGQRLFFRERRPGQALAVLYYKDGVDGTPRPLIDPARLSDDASVTLSDIHPCADGSLLAYRLSTSGSSLRPLHVMHVDREEALPDVIPGWLNPVAHAWHSENKVRWTPDKRGFYYTRRPASAPADEARYHQKLYFHRLGDHWSEDVLVFGESLRASQSLYPRLSDDGRDLVISVHDFAGDAATSEIHYCRLDPGNLGHEFVRVAVATDAFLSARVHRGVVYVQTDADAVGGEIVSVTTDAIARGRVELETVVPETGQALRAWLLAGDYIIVETLEQVSSRLRVYDLAGALVKHIPLPALGSVTALRGAALARHVYFSFASFCTPRTIYRLDLDTLELALDHEPPAPCDPAMFTTRQVWYPSRDGTQVPMFLVHRVGLELDGDTPTVVHGYGGFNVSVVPSYKAQIIPFLERGGVYAVANVRGGGELGSAWHQAGVRERKQNSFDDFNAAAEWLIAAGYTNRARLGCYGWSNGGLLVNAAAVARPELWQAVVAGSPVTDLARFHLGAGGRHCVADYGSPEDPDDLSFMLRHSPYHCMPDEIDAPAVLMFVPDEDDRVAPWHGYKMFARWQAASSSDRPILLRGSPKSGHHGGASLDHALARNTDIWSFLFWQLGVPCDLRGC